MAPRLLIWSPNHFYSKFTLKSSNTCKNTDRHIPRAPGTLLKKRKLLQKALHPPECSHNPIMCLCLWVLQCFENKCAQGHQFKTNFNLTNRNHSCEFVQAVIDSLRNTDN